MIASRDQFSTGESAFAVDHRGVIVSWNPAAEATFGYSESKAVGQRCWDLLAGQDVFGNQYCCAGCPLREMASHHRSINPNELFFTTNSHERKKFRVSTLVVHDSSGNELLLHLCHPDRDTRDERKTSAGTSRTGNNRQRGALSTREKEVLEMVSRGKSTQEIAEEMCISPATVRNHVQHILYKLRVHNRMAAIHLGKKIGLI